jgi:membrane protease YdiL (CAAX protease family)
LDNLISHRQFALWTRFVGFLDVWAALFFVLQMLMVVASFRWGKVKLDVRTLIGALKPTSLTPLLLGSVAGVALYLVSLPLLVKFDSHNQFSRLITDNPFSLRSILLAFLFLCLVPLTTELAFRGIIFATLQQESNLLTALIVSCGLFGYIWPIFNGGTALLLGLVTALLYHRYRQLLPGIIASAVLILLSTSTLVWRLLTRG